MSLSKIVLRYVEELSSFPPCVYRVGAYAGIVLLAAYGFIASLGYDALTNSYTLTTTFVALYCLHRTLQLQDPTSKSHDQLTGLLTREPFLRGTERILRQSLDQVGMGPVMLVIDIRRFGRINGALGYETGDALLAQIAERLRSVVGEQDLLARIGGDEFAITLHSGAARYGIFCEELVKAFAEPFELNNGIETTVGIATGVAYSPEHGATSFDLMRNSCIAVAESKRSRRPYAVYSPNLLHPSVDNWSITNDIKSGIENNEFLFHFQPQLDLKTGRICGVEALLRWNHPTRGLLGPDMFIALAEQSNQIMQLTEWTLREGVSKLAHFRELDLDVTLSINISPFALVTNDMLTMLTKEIVYRSIPYQSLTVEITESTIKESPEALAKIIACLEMLGVHISIDDFGTGHSSLLYLKHMPIKEIKIDKTFIANMLSSPADGAIVKSTIDLAHSLSCVVVAEGVETKEVLDRLVEIGCDRIQGYYISRPLVEADFLALLKVDNGPRPNQYLA